MQQAHGTDLPQDLDDWELSEGGLPEGSTLSGSKALLDECPEDEANFKEKKIPTPAKGKRATPSPRKAEGHYTTCAR